MGVAIGKIAHKQDICLINLPLEVLRLIPTSYREWQLLRLTCPALYTALGNYHEYYKISMVTTRQMSPPYSVFISTLMTYMFSPYEKRQSYAHMILRTGERIVWMREYCHETGLYIYHNKNICASLKASSCMVHINGIVSVGKQHYITNGRWEQQIYDELPELAMRMRITCRLTARYVAHQ